MKIGINHKFFLIIILIIIFFGLILCPITWIEISRTQNEALEAQNRRTQVNVLATQSHLEALSYLPQAQVDFVKIYSEVANITNDVILHEINEEGKLFTGDGHNLALNCLGGQAEQIHASNRSFEEIKLDYLSKFIEEDYEHFVFTDEHGYKIFHFRNLSVTILMYEISKEDLEFDVSTDSQIYTTFYIIKIEYKIPSDC